MSVTINGTNGLIFNDASTQNTAATGFGFKNRIINGDMRIDQRNAGALVAGAAGNIFAVDRFPTGVFGSGTGRISAQQSNTVPTNAGFLKSVINTVTTADASPSQYYGYCFQHKIEGFNTADLNWGTANAQPVTLSFWVRSSIAGTYIATFSNENADRAYSATYTISAANAWEQKIITVAGDTTGTWYTTNGTGIQIFWGLGGGTGRQAPSTNTWNTGAGGYAVTDAPGCVDWIATSGATFYITGVQLEKGSTATSFDYRPYGTELQLCQRYYQAYYGTNSTLVLFSRGYSVAVGNTYPIAVPIKVTFRSAPTGTIVGTWATTNASQPFFSSTSVEAVGLSFNASGSGDTFVYPNSSSVGITLSAEL